MKVIAKAFSVSTRPDGAFEVEITDAESVAVEKTYDITTAAKLRGVSRGTIVAEITRRPELACRLGPDGKILIRASSLDKMLVPYAVNSRVKITEG